MTGLLRLLLVPLLPLLRRQRPHDLADDAQHDLVRPAPDGRQPQVAVQPRHVDVFGEAHPAPELEARVGHLPDLGRQKESMIERAGNSNSRNNIPAKPASLQLQHGRVHRHVLPRQHGVHGRVDRPTEQLHLRLQLSQPVWGWLSGGLNMFC